MAPFAFFAPVAASLNARQPLVSSRLAGLLFLGLLLGCGGGGGSSSGSFDSVGTLTGITFPDPEGVNATAVQVPPLAAPLVQQVEFTFSGNPRPSQVNAERLSIRDPSGFPVAGRFEVEANVVRFTPTLPRQTPTAASPHGDAGLRPGTSYNIRVGPSTWPSFIKAVDPAFLKAFADPADPQGVLVTFLTTTKTVDYFRGLPAKAPRLTHSDPPDGAVGIGPHLYEDPEGLFPASHAFVLHFDAPMNPDASNLAGFQLVDLDAKSAEFPLGLPLGVSAVLRSNELDGCTVEVRPSGILPFGHWLALEYPEQLLALATPVSRNDDRLEDPEDRVDSQAVTTRVASTFTVASAPSDTIRDVLREDFQSRDRDDTVDAAPGFLPADWNRRGSGRLEPGFAFQGNGELGAFRPLAPADGSVRTITLDTSRQSFPLLDGSTPEAAPGTEVLGGVFAFTCIEIPKGVTLRVRGSNPLILSATESVIIAGDVDLSGQAGTDEDAFDSAVTILPGGAGVAGGGRGGEGQPLAFRGNVVSQSGLVSPSRGGRGWGPSNAQRSGGHGGQCGTFDTNVRVRKRFKGISAPCDEGFFVEEDIDGKDWCISRIVDDKFWGTDVEIDCNELSNDHHSLAFPIDERRSYRPPGGGGGSHLRVGQAPKQDGLGNVLADGQGNYLLRRPADFGDGWDVLLRGQPGDWPFSDGVASNNFIGVRGEQAVAFGGQGGGAGGSALDGYFCGHWCKSDANPDNDGVCRSDPIFGSNPTVGSSSVDARGGAGGAGGGAFVVESLGPIVVAEGASLNCRGGNGGGGEQLGCGNYSGAGGGGSGGCVILRSATDLEIQDKVSIDVRGGNGRNASNWQGALLSCTQLNTRNRGSGGGGGRGLIQLQVPRGQTADVDAGAELTSGSWVDQNNDRNPVEFTPVSVAVSSWYDMGRVVERPPRGTHPSFRFTGTDDQGFVRTDGFGNVVNAGRSDIRVDFLGQSDPTNPGQFLPGLEPRSHFIPANATVRVEFQGGEPVVPGSKEVDPETQTDWSVRASVADGHQFLRYRITFDIAADQGEQGVVGPDSPRPVVQEIKIRAEF